jgi:hypothetical protein
MRQHPKCPLAGRSRHQSRARNARISVELNSPGLPPQILSEVRISLPPLVEQRHLVDVLNERRAAVDVTLAAAAVQLTELNNLESALIRAAFSGAL